MPWTSTLHPMRASGSPPRGLPFPGKAIPRGSGGRGPQPRCSRVGQLFMGYGGGRGTRPHQPSFFYPSSAWFFSSLLKGIPWFLKHSVGDILVKMQYFYVM